MLNETNYANNEQNDLNMVISGLIIYFFLNICTTSIPSSFFYIIQMLQISIQLKFSTL
jgi:hypothetical protein